MAEKREVNDVQKFLDAFANDLQNDEDEFQADVIQDSLPKDKLSTLSNESQVQNIVSVPVPPSSSTDTVISINVVGPDTQKKNIVSVPKLCPSRSCNASNRDLVSEPNQSALVLTPAVHEQFFPCLFCDYKTKIECELRLHNIRIHNFDYWPCWRKLADGSQCPNVYRNSGELLRHRDWEHDNRKIVHSGMNFSPIRPNFLHHCYPELLRYVCVWCGRRYKDIIDLDAHQSKKARCEMYTILLDKGEKAYIRMLRNIVPSTDMLIATKKYDPTYLRRLLKAACDTEVLESLRPLFMQQLSKYPTFAKNIVIAYDRVKERVEEALTRFSDRATPTEDNSG